MEVRSDEYAVYVICHVSYLEVVILVLTSGTNIRILILDPCT